MRGFGGVAATVIIVSLITSDFLISGHGLVIAEPILRIERNKPMNNFRNASFAAATLVAVTLVSNGSAQAFSFTKLIKGAEKTVGHVATGAVKDVGHAAAFVAKPIGKAAVTVGRDIGKAAVKTDHFIDREAAKPAAKLVINVTGKALDTAGNVMDRAGNIVKAEPIVQAAAPLLHDMSKALHSRTAHIGAAVGAGLALGGGALGPAADGGIGSSGVSRVAFASGQGALTGYYGRQLYLAARCSKQNPETKTCTRLESKP